mmetsp:Transcript_17788/g.44499  ORF Transcript_17788/g.44499 Transcript_17788/m.44499 type:complete len:295 (-) Transcript_17788:3316-4200(-)
MAVGQNLCPGLTRTKSTSSSIEISTPTFPLFSRAEDPNAACTRNARICPAPTSMLVPSWGSSFAGGTPPGGGFAPFAAAADEFRFTFVDPTFFSPGLSLFLFSSSLEDLESFAAGFQFGFVADTGEAPVKSSGEPGSRFAPSSDRFKALEFLEDFAFPFAAPAAAFVAFCGFSAAGLFFSRAFCSTRSTSSFPPAAFRAPFPFALSNFACFPTAVPLAFGVSARLYFFPPIEKFSLTALKGSFPADSNFRSAVFVAPAPPAPFRSSSFASGEAAAKWFLTLLPCMKASRSRSSS